MSGAVDAAATHEIVLATHNPHKVAEFHQIIAAEHPESDPSYLEGAS